MVGTRRKWRFSRGFYVGIGPAKPGQIVVEFGSHAVPVKKKYVAPLAQKGAIFIDGEVGGTPGMVEARKTGAGPPAAEGMHDQRQRDPPENVDRAATVDTRRLLDLLRHRVEGVAHATRGCA